MNSIHSRVLVLGIKQIFNTDIARNPTWTEASTLKFDITKGFNIGVKCRMKINSANFAYVNPF